MESFLAEVTTAEWNAHQDAGRPWAEGVELLVAEHPQRRELIEAFHRRWPEMLAGEIPGTVDVLADLRAAGVRLVALSNWSAEMFPVARERFDFLAWFEGIVISGEVGVNKPDRRIFDHLAEQFGIEPAAALFIDDSSANVDAAKALGFRAIRFTDATALRRELVRLGLLPDDPGCVASGIATSQRAARTLARACSPDAPLSCSLEPQKQAKCRAVGTRCASLTAA